MKFTEAFLIIFKLIFERFLLLITLLAGLTFVIYGMLLQDSTLIFGGLFITTLGFFELIRVVRNLPIGYGTIRGSLNEYFQSPSVKIIFGLLLDERYNETGFEYFEAMPARTFVKSMIFAVSFDEPVILTEGALLG